MTRAHGPVRAVVLDVGETLVDETRLWGLWADAVGVPRLTFFAVLGQVIARGEPLRTVFDIVAPGADVDAHERALLASGGATVGAVDLYPDALACLQAVAASGRRVGIAGNQPASTSAALRALGVRADLVASSQEWGVAKPSPAFFARIVAELGVDAREIAYVGDRVDNDVVPAAEAGMVALLLRRGPWAAVQQHWPQASAAHAVLDSLDALPGALDALEGASRARGASGAADPGRQQGVGPQEGPGRQ